MASLRNALPRREHRERAQLSSRQHLGILEKKKDYKLRAKDYNRKQDRLRALREKASFRNPDEFYFGMIRGTKFKASDGVEKRTAEEELLATSRDASYVYVKARMDASKTEKLKSELHFLGHAEAGNQSAGAHSTPKHTFFVEDTEEQDNFDAAKRLDVPRELLPQSFNRPRTADLDRYVPRKNGPESISKAERKKAAQYRELSERLKRSKRLKKLALSIDMEKELKGKGVKYKVKEKDPWTEAPAVYRWRKQRQR